MTDTNTAAALSAEADGWIEWHGGENPVPGQEVTICLRGEGRPTAETDYNTGFSDFVDWDHTGKDGDIIAYRVAAPAPAALEGSSSGDAVSIAKDIRALCIGHPHAKFAWPHRELHALADRIEALQPSSAADAKPVAWRFKGVHDPRREWGYSDRDVSHDTGYDVVQPLYAQPHPSQQAGAEGEALGLLIERLESWPISFASGVCMCGAEMDGHPIDNHAPTDSGEYNVGEAIKEAKAALKPVSA